MSETNLATLELFNLKNLLSKYFICKYKYVEKYVVKLTFSYFY
jgi:hypothetical protein